MPGDTPPEMERVWIDLWRQKTPAFRLQRASELTTQVIRRSKAGIAKAHPERSSQEVDLLWAELDDGNDTADRVRQHLREQA